MNAQKATENLHRQIMYWQARIATAKTPKERRLARWNLQEAHESWQKLATWVNAQNRNGSIFPENVAISPHDPIEQQDAQSAEQTPQMPTDSINCLAACAAPNP